jgi:Acetyltransferase (GNAT) domain
MEQVASLYAYVYRASPEAPLNWHVPYWTRDMFSGRHPLIGPHDFAVVEDATTSTIVASTCLLRYTFEFEGIPVPFGRPEVVATMPEYRNRGLIRAIFPLIHGKSEARGDLVQGITGIQNYYRQFGYEYAIPEGVGLTVYFPASLHQVPCDFAKAVKPSHSRLNTLLVQSSVAHNHQQHSQLEPMFSSQPAPDVFAFLFSIHRIDNDRVAELELLAGKRLSHRVGSHSCLKTPWDTCLDDRRLDGIHRKER